MFFQFYKRLSLCAKYVLLNGLFAFQFYKRLSICIPIFHEHHDSSFQFYKRLSEQYWSRWWFVHCSFNSIRDYHYSGLEDKEGKLTTFQFYKRLSIICMPPLCRGKFEDFQFYKRLSQRTSMRKLAELALLSIL